jgi:hypothetical protein
VYGTLDRQKANRATRGGAVSEINVDQPNIVVVMYDQLTPSMLG